MDDYSKLSASDGTGEAVVANIENDRAPAAVTLDVDNVDNWPADFICVTGTLNPNNYIDNSSMTIFYGHIDAGNIVIDSFAPGYTDVGNTAGQIAIIKPTTEWVNQVVELAMVAHQDNGKLKTTSLDEFYKPSDITSNFVFSGGIWTGDSYASTRNASMTELVCYINGIRGTVAAVTARAFTASKDTYVDVLNAAGVFSLVYTEVANNAASPALAANSIRIATVVTDATDIQASTSIGQGGFQNIVPVVSGTTLAGFDSLGNLIYPKGGNTRLPSNPYKFSAYCSGGKAVNNATVIVDLQTELFDTNANFASSRYTAPVAGFYQINAQAWWGSAGAGTNEYATIHIRKNGSATGMPESDRSNGSGTADKLIRPQIHSLIQLAAGDYIELWITTVGSRDLTAGQTVTYMNGYLVSAS